MEEHKMNKIQNKEVKESFIKKHCLKQIMGKIVLSLPDGKKIEAEKGVLGIDLIKTKIGEGLARAALAVKVNGKVKDVYLPLEESGDFKVLTFNDEEGKEVFRHSSAHLLAHAVIELFPNAKTTIGPVVEEGFYYDFDSSPFTQEDLAKIEQKMREISERKLDIRRIEI